MIIRTVRNRIILLSLAALVSCQVTSWTEAVSPSLEEVEERMEDERWESLVSALSYVESRDDDEARNPSSSALGRWQMTRIYVDEVNRIQGLRGETERFGYGDRTDAVKAREMFDIYQSFHNPDRDIELAIRLHRGLDSPRYRRAVLDKMEETL